MDKTVFATTEISPERREEYEDITKLLLDHRSGAGSATEEVACLVAAACLGENHLWQDLKLPSRKDLSELMEYHFRPLLEKNTRDMKWKKFFYKQICEREGFYLCKSPSCGVCIDYNKCYGPEE